MLDIALNLNTSAQKLMLVQPFIDSNTVWCVSYQFVIRSWDTDSDSGLFCLPGLEKGLAAGMTCRLLMLIPPRHLIPFCYIQGSPVLWLIVPTGFVRLVCFRYITHFIRLMFLYCPFQSVGINTWMQNELQSLSLGPVMQFSAYITLPFLYSATLMDSTD
jgi:hypothetical protein